MSSYRVIALSFTVVGLSFLGCDGESEKADSAKTEHSLRAKFGDRDYIMLNIVVRAYEQGRLGTRQQGEVVMEPFFSLPDYGYKIPKPFGQLRQADSAGGHD